MNILSCFNKSFFLIIISLLISYTSELFAVGPQDFISFSTAVFDALQNDESSLEGRIEYRADSFESILKPFAGFMANTDGGRYIYSGVLLEIPMTEFIAIVPSFAPGFYIRNYSKDLHFVLEFRSQLEVVFTVSNDLKAGLSFSHVSNASLGKANPGVESIAFTILLPVFW